MNPTLYFSGVFVFNAHSIWFEEVFIHCAMKTVKVWSRFYIQCLQKLFQHAVIEHM